MPTILPILSYSITEDGVQSLNAGAALYSGVGIPDVAAPVGSFYINLAGPQLYLKQSGTGITGWVQFSGGGGGGGSPPVYTPLTLAAGQHDDVELPGAADYILAYDASEGAADITGFEAQEDGQTLIILCAGSDLIQLLPDNNGSESSNQIVAPADVAVVQNQSIVIRYSAGAGKWLLV